MKNMTISLIGAGNMGTSLLSGLLDDGYNPNHIWISDPSSEKTSHFVETFGVHACVDNTRAAEAADILILAVKPQTLPAVLKEIAPIINTKKPLVISIAAGISTTILEKWIGEKTAIIRAMPNLAATVRSSATTLFANALVSDEQQNEAESILRAVGISLWIEDESLLDVVTALSGSGPAYFFLLMQALQEAAVEQGLPEALAGLLTLETGLGAAKLALESDRTPAELCEQVASPGGTTEAALKVLTSSNMKTLFADALLAAKQRSEDLVNQITGDK